VLPNFSFTRQCPRQGDGSAQDIAQDGCDAMLAVAFEADAAQRNHLVMAFDLVEGL